MPSTLFALILVAASGPASRMISVGYLNKEQEAEIGITMKSRKNGDAGVMVWLECKKEGVLAAFNYAELRMKDDEGEYLLSALLRARGSPRSTGRGHLGGVLCRTFGAEEVLDHLPKVVAQIEWFP